MPALALTARGLEKHHRVGWTLRRRRALAAFDLDLARGERLGVVGPNGSGKSSFLRLVAGVERPSAGSLLVLGASPAEGGVRAAIGYLSEEASFPVELSAARALELCGALRGLRGRELRERAARRLAQVGLAEHARVPLGRFSRGMLRRFGLAQAALHEPELLVLDEPSAGLDAPGFGVLEELLGEARARGATLVLATHLDLDVERHCDRLALFSEGRLAAHGAKSALLARAGAAVFEAEGLEDLAGLERAERAVADALAAHGAELVCARAAAGSLLELYRRHGAA